MDRTITVVLEDFFEDTKHSIFIDGLDPSIRITSADLNNLLRQKLRDHFLEDKLAKHMSHHRTHLRLELDNKWMHIITEDTLEQFMIKGKVSLILSNSAGNCMYCLNKITAPNHGRREYPDDLDNSTTNYLSHEEYALVSEFMRVAAKAKMAMKDQAKENALTIVKKLVRLSEESVNMLSNFMTMLNYGNLNLFSISGQCD